MALTIDGSDPTGDLGDLLDAKLPIAGGKILQIVRATDSTDRSTTSATFVDVTGMSVTITPQKSDSAVLLIVTANCFVTENPETQLDARFVITDSSDNTISGSAARLHYNGATSAFHIVASYLTIIGYATPATTSATTFKLRFRIERAGNTVEVRNGTDGVGSFYAIEVSA